MSQRIVCITAAQRAGTTALQHILAATGEFRNYGEIFHTKQDVPAEESRCSFMGFANTNDLKLADTMTLQGVSKAARRYLDALRRDAAPMHVLIDVKLNSWFALSPAWNYPHDAPFFLRFLRREQAIFIFIWRRSLADQVLSAFISREFGVWHNLDEAEVAGRQLRAPVKKLCKTAIQICKSEADIREQLRNYPDKIEVAYEDLYQNGKLVNTFCRKMTSLSGARLRTTEVRGISPNRAKKSEIVVNYSEAVSEIERIAREYRSFES